MQNQFSINIIIPVYNTEPWLRECLDSVIHQTIPFHEIIVINDGSTDNSAVICKQYASLHHNIIYLEQKNQGLGATRNHGLEVATGDYTMFLDSDDYLDLHTVEALTNCMTTSTTPDVIYFDAEAFLDGIDNPGFTNPYTRSWRIKQYAHQPFSGMQWISRTFPRDYHPSSCLALYRLDFLNRHAIRFPVNLYYEDNPFSVRVWSYADTVVYVDTPLYIRRYRPDSITTRAYSEKMFLDYSAIVSLIYNDFLSRPNALASNIIVQYVIDLLYISVIYFNRSKKEGRTTTSDAFSQLRMLCDKLCRLLESYPSVDDVLRLESLVLLLLLQRKLEELNLRSDETTFYAFIASHRIPKRAAAAYRTILMDLPLHRGDMTVAFYGGGKNTFGILSLYQLLVGDIHATLLIADSKQNNGVINDIPVIHYGAITDEIDCVIIASYAHEHVMEDNLNAIRYSGKVVNFYREMLNRDVFSDYEIISTML